MYVHDGSTCPPLTKLHIFQEAKNHRLVLPEICAHSFALCRQTCKVPCRIVLWGRALHWGYKPGFRNLSCQSQLAEEQHEQIFLLNIGFLNLQCYFGEAICTGLFRTDFLHGFLHGFSARIFCTDFLHGFFARIFCTDFLHGFFCTVFCPIFLRGFLRGLFARIVCTDVARIFARIFSGCPKTLCWEAPKFHRENPLENSPCLGAFWGGAREAGG